VRKTFLKKEATSVQKTLFVSLIDVSAKTIPITCCASIQLIGASFHFRTVLEFVFKLTFYYSEYIKE